MVFSLFCGHWWPSKKFRKVGVGRSSSKQFVNMWELNKSYLPNRQILIATDFNTTQLDFD